MSAECSEKIERERERENRLKRLLFKIKMLMRLMEKKRKSLTKATLKPPVECLTTCIDGRFLFYFFSLETTMQSLYAEIALTSNTIREI